MPVVARNPFLNNVFVLDCLCYFACRIYNAMIIISWKNSRLQELERIKLFCYKKLKFSSVQI